jgi:nucleotide-binding universal stress UspA family protein
MVKKILVAFDGSEQAKRALDLGLEIADKFSANTVLLGVVDYMPIIDEEYVNNLKRRYEEILSEALVKAQSAKPNLQITEMLTEGRPADKIIEKARDEKFDMVVMGSRGSGGISEFIRGSVSDKVVDEAPCPVVIVK